MLRTVLSLLVIACLAAAPAHAAGVTGIQLDYEDGGTVATIQVNGPVQFAHQTVEAKDGKPFRVIVDLLSSVHQLGAMSFDNLPTCPINSIRTSQYSVDPERVVRVVFDMAGETIYRVDAVGNTVTVYFPDKQNRTFATWKSSAHLPGPSKAKPVTTAKADPPKQDQPSARQVNKKIEKDRQASLTARSESDQPVEVAQKPQPKAQPKAQAKAPAQKQPQKSAPVQLKPGETYGPTVDPALLAKVREREAKEAEAAKQRAEAKKAAATTAPANQPATVATTPAPKQQATPQKPQPSTTAAAKPAQPKAKTLATTDAKADKPKESAPSTSRFRRTPAKSKKIAGTMVVEFPKRLTIKYQAGRTRDPFETLINESKTYDGPVHERVPNVEALRLVGVIESPDQGNRALFQDKDGYGYILKSGDKVERGVVLRVEADRVYFQIFEYGWSRTVALRLDSE